MATLKQRLHRKNASGTYDVIHMETSADLVKRADGTKNVESSLAEIESWNPIKYEENGTVAPYLTAIDADTLEGHPASDFVKASDSYTKEQTLSNETKVLYGLESNAIPDDAFFKINEKLSSSVGGIEMTSLWQNASPGSEFVNQVVSIPKMNEYTFICIKYASDTNQAEYIWSVIADCSHNGMITAHMHSLKYRSAIIKPDINAIHFYNCTFSTTDENSKSNMYMIPLEVYGVKGIAIYRRDA